MGTEPQDHVSDTVQMNASAHESRAENSVRDKRWMFWGIAICGALLDLVTKKLVFAFCPPEGLVIIPGHFSLVCSYNLGGIFGIGHRFPTIFVVLSLVCIAVVYLFYRKAAPTDLLTPAGLGVILAGALGNLYDRLTLGAVRDFLHFYWGDKAWPTFNLADAFLCVGVGLCMLAIWRSEQEG